MLLKNKNIAYLGEFLNDEFHKGKIYQTNGDNYEGDFRNN